MKICLNQRMQYLSESFHKGELTLADYRELRREEFEQLNSPPQKHQNAARQHRPFSGASSKVAKKIFVSTFLAITLLILTVLLVRYLV